MGERPRPPRRLPPGADQRQATVIERATPSPGPMRRAARAWYLVPLALVMIAAGAGLGWILRDRERILDPDEVLAQAGESVVQVYATTCAGTGRGAGLRLTDGSIVTSASIIRSPVSVAVRSNDGTVRRASVAGVSSDGIALLRIYGTLPGRSAELATGGSQSEEAFLGYDDHGVQVVQRIDTKDVTGDTIGGPLVDAHGTALGLAVLDGQNRPRLIPAAELQSYKGTAPPVTTEPLGKCKQATGSRAQEIVQVSGPTNAFVDEVTRTLQAYVDAVNAHDFAAIKRLYTGFLDSKTVADIARQHRTSYLFQPKLRQVVPDGDGARADMSFAMVHWIDGDGGVRGLTCSRWTVSYTLQRVDGRLLMAAANTPAGQEQAFASCDE